MIGESDKLKQTENRLRQMYSFVAKNDTEEVIIAITNLIDRYSTGMIQFKTLLEELSRTIHRVFHFQYVCLAMKDLDGKFRYKTVIGPAQEGIKAMLQIAYTPSELFNENTYPSTAISEITRFYMSESVPYTPDEVTTYARPAMLNKERSAPDDMLEADYIDIYAKNARNEILGYIELGTTRDGKLPDKRIIMWIESIARIYSIILSEGIA